MDGVTANYREVFVIPAHRPQFAVHGELTLSKLNSEAGSTGWGKAEIKKTFSYGAMHCVYCTLRAIIKTRKSQTAWEFLTNRFINTFTSSKTLHQMKYLKNPHRPLRSLDTQKPNQIVLLGLQIRQNQNLDPYHLHCRIDRTQLH